MSDTEQRDAETRVRAPFDLTLLDLADCTRTEIILPLYEHEKAGQRMESWPAAVQVRAAREVQNCTAEQSGFVLRALTTGVIKYRGKPSCVLILHHAKKAP